MMRVISEIDQLFILAQSPFRSLKNEFIAYRLEEYDECPHLTSLPPSRTLFYQIRMNMNGSMKFTCNGSRLVTRHCTLSFISPFHITTFEQVGRISGLCFLFSESFMNYAFQSEYFHNEFSFFWTNHNHFFIDDEDAPLFLQIGEKILNEYKKQDTLSEKIIKDYLHIFLLEAKRTAKLISIAEDRSSGFRLLQQFYKLVNSSIPLLRSVDKAAESLCVTPGRLWCAVKKLTHQSPLEIINQRIFTEAKSLLIHSELTISEIGFYLQFKEKSHFTRFFKNLSGIPPVDWVRQWRMKK
jgi:AraC family transcriptional regulator, transcriptional activator of pobA